MERSIWTQAAHAATCPPPVPSIPVAAPLYQDVAFAISDLDECDLLAEGHPPDRFYYYRYGTPNHQYAEQVMCRLEQTEAAASAASGMAAIFAAVAGLLKHGDHLLAERRLYGGSYALLKNQLSRLGIEVDFVEMDDLPAVWDGIKPHTRALLLETITNPLLSVTDLPALASLAREGGLKTIVDATFTTPYLSRPHAMGIDLVVHASTKYLGGHSDVMGGIVLGRADDIDPIRQCLREIGATQSPFDAWLLGRSLRTLPLRMQRHCENALAVAEFLATHPRVSNVIYPYLLSHPHHERARTLLERGGGGMVTCTLDGGRDRVDAFIRRLKLIRFVPSLGDVTTTVTHPASSSHRMLPPEERARAGVTDGMVRFSVGIEDPADLLADLEAALQV